MATGGEFERALEPLSGMETKKAKVGSRSKGRYDRLLFTGGGWGAPFLLD